MMNKQHAERLHKVVRLSAYDAMDNEYTRKLEEATARLESLKAEQAKTGEGNDLWLDREIIRVSTSISFLKQLECERKKYDELRGLLGSVLNVY